MNHFTHIPFCGFVCVCVRERGGGGEVLVRYKENWRVRPFPCQTFLTKQRISSLNQVKRIKRTKQVCFWKSPQQSISDLNCFNIILNFLRSLAQENEEDICMRWFNDHHHSHWESQERSRGSTDAGEISLCVQRYLQDFCNKGKT